MRNLSLLQKLAQKWLVTCPISTRCHLSGTLLCCIHSQLLFLLSIHISAKIFSFQKSCLNQQHPSLPPLCLQFWLFCFTFGIVTFTCLWILCSVFVTDINCYMTWVSQGPYTSIQVCYYHYWGWGGGCRDWENGGVGGWGWSMATVYVCKWGRPK